MADGELNEEEADAEDEDTESEDTEGGCEQLDGVHRREVDFDQVAVVFLVSGHLQDSKTLYIFLHDQAAGLSGRRKRDVELVDEPIDGINCGFEAQLLDCGVFTRLPQG